MRIFSPLLQRLSKYVALRGYVFCVDNQISDGLERQGLSVPGSKESSDTYDKAYYFRTEIATNVRFREA